MGGPGAPIAARGDRDDVVGVEREVDDIVTGEARGAERRAGALSLAAGRSSMLRLVVAQLDPATGTVRVLGVDDFAFRRGRDYGAFLVNVETGDPVALLRDREAATAQDAPDLQQAAAAAAARRAEDSDLAVRTRQRCELVQALRAQGKGIKPIARETGVAKETVRRFYRAATADELLAKIRDGRQSLLDDHKPYLHQRWNEGCTNVRQLHAELRERGFKGGSGTIRDYMLPFREAGAAPPSPGGRRSPGGVRRAACQPLNAQPVREMAR